MNSLKTELLVAAEADHPHPHPQNVVSEAAPDSILSDSMKIEEELEAAEASLSSSKEELIKHLLNYSVFLKTSGTSVNAVANAADNVIKSLRDPGRNNDLDDALSMFDALASSLPPMAIRLSEQCDDLNSLYLPVIAKFKAARGHYTELTDNLQHYSPTVTDMIFLNAF